jgi:endonuclease YncB( thermonuclease family)
MRCIVARWLALAVLLAPAIVQAAPNIAWVAAVIDGDTLLLKPMRERARFYKLRLAGIDAPELSQPYGIEAGRLLAQLTLHRSVTVTTVATDRYGRRVGWIALIAGDGGQRDINAELVRRGAAWASVWHRHESRLMPLQREARLARRGLWKDRGAMPPWVWRRRADATPVSASTPLPSRPRD